MCVGVFVCVHVCVCTCVMGVYICFVCQHACCSRVCVNLGLRFTQVIHLVQDVLKVEMNINMDRLGCALMDATSGEDRQHGY